MLSRSHRLQIEPLLAAGERSPLERRQEARHHHTRFARPARPDQSEQSPRSALRLLLREQALHRLHKLCNQSVAPKKIGGILPPEGSQPFVWITWLPGRFSCLCCWETGQLALLGADLQPLDRCYKLFEAGRVLCRGNINPTRKLTALFKEGSLTRLPLQSNPTNRPANNAG